MAMQYRPRQRMQINPMDPIGKFGCSAYSAAMAADYATLGGAQIEGWQLRSLTDEPRPDPASPGLNIPQIVEALDDLHIKLYDRSGRTWPTLMGYLASNCGIVLQGDRDQLTSVNLANPFKGDHAILITDIHADGRLLVFDPLLSSPRWGLAAEVRKYAEKLGRTTGLQGGGIRFATTRPVPHLCG